MTKDRFDSHTTLQINSEIYTIYQVDKCPLVNPKTLPRLPYTIRVLLEGAIRAHHAHKTDREEIINLANWRPTEKERASVSLFPGRLIMQDLSGVPVLNDLAAMRSAVSRRGGNPNLINPVIPVDLIIDHSVQVDYAGIPDAFKRNTEIEFSRNEERYRFLHWCQKAFSNIQIAPPSSGIIHQVNLEHLSRAVLVKEENEKKIAFPDTVLGTDSHTTMINGIGVLGWGIGGIEAIGAMLGEPVEFTIPDVVGIYLTGNLPEGTTPTDLTLAIVQMLRKQGVVDKFIEVFGPGLKALDPADRAMIANMTPESGATTIFFPIDAHTLDYLTLTRGDRNLARLVEAYYRTQGLFWEPGAPEPEYTQVLELDMNHIQASLAGPKRPQDRVVLSRVKNSFEQALTTAKNENGFAISQPDLQKKVEIQLNGRETALSHGSVVIAAITSCTNTSNPYGMIAAGLLAQKAVEKGLKKQPFVKTSLAPGSRAVTEYLKNAGLMEPLEQLGFFLVGYGCTTCIGNTGSLPQAVTSAIEKNDLVAASVISGNRNFEGRVSPHTRANYLASPPLVIAYSIAGQIDIDLTSQPIGHTPQGEAVYLKDIWPSSGEINTVIQKSINADTFARSYAGLFQENVFWNSLQSTDSALYPWDSASTYLQEPPFFEIKDHPVADIVDARVLALLGDSITTDHISPAGSIPISTPAGQYLMSLGVAEKDFNSYGSRRGNDRVMARGTFANIRLKNQLVPGIEGGKTLHFPDETVMPIYDAALQYQKEEIPLIILAGKEYGSGSSRDWAAKGALLLGVKAVIAESYERIHRSNLIGMGVLPLQFKAGQNAAALGLNGREKFTLHLDAGKIKPGGEILVTASSESGDQIKFHTRMRLDSHREVDYYKGGGILKTLINQIA